MFIEKSLINTIIIIIYSTLYQTLWNDNMR